MTTDHINSSMIISFTGISQFWYKMSLETSSEIDQRGNVFLFIDVNLHQNGVILFL